MNSKKVQCIIGAVTVILILLVLITGYEFLRLNFIERYATPQEAVIASRKGVEDFPIYTHIHNNVAFAISNNADDGGTTNTLYKNNAGWHIKSGKMICNKLVQSSALSCIELKGQYMISYTASSKIDIGDSIGSEFTVFPLGPTETEIYFYEYVLILDAIPDDYLIYINDEAVKIN